MTLLRNPRAFVCAWLICLPICPSIHLPTQPKVFTATGLSTITTEGFFFALGNLYYVRNWNIKHQAETHCLNLIDQTKLGSKEFPSAFTLKSHIKGSWGRSSKQEAGGLKERPWRNFTYWLTQLEFLYNPGPPSWALAPHFLHHTQRAEPSHTNH